MTIEYANELKREVLCLNPEAATPGMYKVFFVSSEGKQYGASEMSADELRCLADFVKESLASADLAANGGQNTSPQGALTRAG